MISQLQTLARITFRCIPAYGLIKMKYIIILIALLLTGCDCKRGVCISNIDRYTHNYQLWEQPGKTDLDVMKAYLECGGNYPYTGSSGIPGDGVATQICLENAGYNRVAYFERQPTCSKEYNKKYQACQPGAVIPTPSIERRLNSQYCKAEWNSNRPECQP